MAKINWNRSLILESEVSKIIHEQEEYGIYFDTDRAITLLEELEVLKDNLYHKVRKYLDYDISCEESTNSVDKLYKVDNYKEYLLKKGEKQFVKKIRLKDQNYNASVLNHYPSNPDVLGGPFSRINIKEPELSKRDVITKSLLRAGWKPKEFTDTGKPKLTVKGQPVSTLKHVGEFGKSLADWYTYNHRSSQISGFLPYVRDDHRISASCNPCGTNTFRARHRVVANIPRPTSMYGNEMRSLFCVEDGRSFVGADVSGLELRMLAHHMKDEEFTNQILHGDIHTYNQNKAGLSTRDDAKTFIYGFLYGAGNAKIGEIVGGSSKQGAVLKNTFISGLPSLGTLIEKVKAFASKNGWLPSIDGRKIYIRSSDGRLSLHTALNALLQANGSIVTKKAMVISNHEIKKRGLDSHQILFYHDEWAEDCDTPLAEEIGEIMINSMRLAGEYYNLDIPITGEYAIGTNWSIH